MSVVDAAVVASRSRLASAMVLTIDDLYGEPESAADVRSRAWEAMCKWISFRCSRKRGINVPNVFQLYWQVTGADAGSKVRRPVFVLSERFAENYGVEPAQPPPPGTPAVVAGDDLNFYELAITHSRNLTKDEVFVSLREMLFKVGEAASQGRELRIDFGAGHLTASDRRVGFDFSAKMGGGGVGGGGALGRAHKGEAPTDPMLNANAAAPSLLLSGFAAAADSQPPEPVGGQRAGAATELSAEEESRLFAEVDQLDPEERAAAAAEAGAAAAELEAGTRQQIGRVLAVPDEQLRMQTIEDVGAALGARAAELEAQLLASQRETAQVEARLNALTPRQQPKQQPPPKRPPSLAAKGGAAPAAAAAAAAPAPAIGATGLGGAVIGLQGASLQQGGGSSQKGSRVGSSKPASRVGAAKPAAAAAGPALSIGFGAEGSAQVALPPPEPAQPAQHFGRQPPPVRVARSATSSAANSAAARQARQAASQKVAVAPPLPPFRYSMPAAQDAAGTAWRLYAAPEAPVPRGPKAVVAPGPGQGARAVGGLAPPHLDGPVHRS